MFSFAKPRMNEDDKNLYDFQRIELANDECEDYHLSVDNNLMNYTRNGFFRENTNFLPTKKIVGFDSSTQMCSFLKSCPNLTLKIRFIPTRTAILYLIQSQKVKTNTNTLVFLIRIHRQLCYSIISMLLSLMSLI